VMIQECERTKRSGIVQRVDEEVGDLQKYKSREGDLRVRLVPKIKKKSECLCVCLNTINLPETLFPSMQATQEH
jgi:hypothetical protein